MDITAGGEPVGTAGATAAAGGEPRSMVDWYEGGGVWSTPNVVAILAVDGIPGLSPFIEARFHQHVHGNYWSSVRFDKAGRE